MTASNFAFFWEFLSLEMDLVTKRPAGFFKTLRPFPETPFVVEVDFPFSTLFMGTFGGDVFGMVLRTAFTGEPKPWETFMAFMGVWGVKLLETFMAFMGVCGVKLLETFMVFMGVCGVKLFIGVPALFIDKGDEVAFGLGVATTGEPTKARLRRKVRVGEIGEKGTVEAWDTGVLGELAIALHYKSLTNRKYQIPKAGKRKRCQQKNVSIMDSNFQQLCILQFFGRQF